VTAMLPWRRRYPVDDQRGRHPDSEPRLQSDRRAGGAPVSAGRARNLEANRRAIIAVMVARCPRSAGLPR
jgi:hypothetical protein